VGWITREGRSSGCCSRSRRSHEREGAFGRDTLGAAGVRMGWVAGVCGRLSLEGTSEGACGGDREGEEDALVHVDGREGWLEESFGCCGVGVGVGVGKARLVVLMSRSKHHRPILPYIYLITLTSYLHLMLLSTFRITATLPATVALVSSTHDLESPKKVD
jgi:hypothetical protein